LFQLIEYRDLKVFVEVVPDRAVGGSRRSLSYGLARSGEGAPPSTWATNDLAPPQKISAHSPGNFRRLSSAQTFSLLFAES